MEELTQQKKNKQPNRFTKRSVGNQLF